MKFFLTHHKYDNLPLLKGATIHYYNDCKSLNADYEKGNVHAPNSGVKQLEFSSFGDLENFFVKKNYQYSICTSCEMKENDESHRKNLEEEKKHDEFMKEIINEYHNFKK